MKDNQKIEDTIEIPVGKYISAIRRNPWQLVSLVLFIALIASLLWEGKSSTKIENIVDEKVASQNLVSFINSQGIGKVEVVSTGKVGQFYEIVLKLNNEEIPAYVTQDGNFFVLNPIPISPNAPKLKSIPPPKIPEIVNVGVINISDSPKKGDRNAKVVLVEFSDYQCLFCQKFFNETYPRLISEYMNMGKVLFVFKDFPLINIHPQAQKAAEAARCVKEQQGDKGYFLMHDKLYSNQENLTNENYLRLAKQVGVIPARFTECLEKGKYADEVENDLKYGASLGVDSTPTFFVNGKKLSGAVPFDEFKKIIEEELSLTS